MEIEEKITQTNIIKKIIISDELTDVLKKCDSYVSKVLLSGLMPDIVNNTDKDFNFLDLSKSVKGHISYLTKDRLEKIKSDLNDDVNVWDSKFRYHGKPGSVLKKMIKCSSYDIEMFSNEFNSLVNPPVFHFEIVSGEDITKYYFYENYLEQRGSLGGSCMKSSPGNFFDIYSHNDNIKMLVMLSENNKVMGRSLLFYDKDGNKIMDRIYVINDIYIHYFKNWANENDYFYKKYNNAQSPKHWIKNGEEVIKDFNIKLNETIFENYPYLDTFKWLDVVNKTLTNYKPDYNYNIRVISDHTGKYFSYDYLSFCDINNMVYSNDYIIHIDYCDMNVNRDCVNYSNPLNRFILFSDSVYDDSGFYIFKKELDHYNDYGLINKYKESRMERYVVKTPLKNFYMDEDMEFLQANGDEPVIPNTNGNHGTLVERL